LRNRRVIDEEEGGWQWAVHDASSRICEIASGRSFRGYDMSASRRRARPTSCICNR